MEIFRAYDIRGIYPDEINEEVVFKIAAGLVKFLNPDKLVIANDTRESSWSLKESAIGAITASGVDVIDIGEADSPLFYFSVNKLNAGGGIMITASHNPPNYNGLKLVQEQAIPIGEQSGLLQIKKLAEDIKIRGIRKGKSVKKDLSKEYNAYLLKKAGLVKEPEIDGVKFQFDPDFDRLLVFEKEKQIRADLLYGIIVKDYLDKSNFWLNLFGKEKFVYDLRFTKAIPEYIEQNRGEAIRSRVGYPFIREKMREHKAIFGAELSGHFYFKDVFYAEAPILMKLKILKIMRESGKSLAELIRPFEKYFHSGEININIPPATFNIKNLFQRLKENYKDGKVEELDGLTVEYWNPDPIRGKDTLRALAASNGASWWFNLRPSNTEPVLRLVVEAETRYIMEQKIKELVDLIESI